MLVSISPSRDSVSLSNIFQILESFGFPGGAEAIIVNFSDTAFIMNTEFDKVFSFSLRAVIAEKYKIYYEKFDLK